MSHAKHSHPKKVALPKGALLLKLLSAFCVMNSVGAAAVPGPLNIIGVAAACGLSMPAPLVFAAYTMLAHFCTVQLLPVCLWHSSGHDAAHPHCVFGMHARD